VLWIVCLARKKLEADKTETDKGSHFMSKFIRNFALFVAGLPFATTKAAAPANQVPTMDHDGKAVSLRPLNLEMDNLFASHRSHSSHSSHASHSSHYSGSGGYSTPYIAPAPVSSASAASAAVAAPEAASPATAASAAGTSRTSLAATVDSVTVKPGELTLAEKRRLQVLRVQIKLNSLKLYDGQLTGVLDEPTRESLKLFQGVKNLPMTGMMTTPTLNALGIPAVR
jgi:His-Xaa-Ser repeat protein HxsA